MQSGSRLAYEALLNLGGGGDWALMSGGVAATLDIDFVNDRAKNGATRPSIASLLTCTRATPAAAYYTKADGTLTTFAANTLRTGTNGLLVEEARTNIFTQSIDFNSDWQILNSTRTAGQSAPDGTTNAIQLTASAGNSQHRLFINGVTMSAVANAMSVYAKAGTNRWIQVLTNDGTTSFYANFDLTGGVVGSKQAATTATITLLASGWYRCTILATLTNTGANAQVLMCGSSDPGTVAAPFVDLAGTETAFFWGAQQEVGAFATSYIPTTTASVTRAADVVSMSGAPFTSTLNASVGTLYGASVRLANQGAANPNLFGASDGTDNNRWLVQATGATAGRLLAITSGSLDVSSSITISAVGGLDKVAFGYQVNNTGISANGGAAVTDASCAVPPVTQFDLGNSHSADVICALISRFAYWNTRLSDVAIQALTV